MKGLKKITSIVLAFAMVVTICGVNTTHTEAAVKIVYGKKLTLSVGQKDDIIVKKGKAIYISANKEIARVSKKGRVTAKKPGITKITVRVGKSKAKATVTVKPATIKNVSAALTSINSAKVTWSKSTGVTGYYVYQSTKKNSGYKKIATVKGAKKTSYEVKGLTLGNTYYYKVKAYAKASNKTLVSSQYSKLDQNGLTSSVRTWKLVWNDEFAGTKLDTTKWNNDGATGAGGYGNKELQDYQIDYCKVEDGKLVIMPQFKWNTTTKKTVPDEYYSTKLWTRGQNSFKYGKIEFHAKLPKGQGTWAAAWMLGVNNTWPLCGEIDVMETTSEASKVMIPQTIHCNRFNGMPTSPGCKNKVTRVNDATTAYHTYGIIWDEEVIKFTIDGKETWTYNPDNFKASGNGNGDIQIWPFNQPFYLILNCAIGGTLGGQVTPDFWTKIATDGNIETYQDYYYIDWVRVSQ